MQHLSDYTECHAAKSHIYFLQSRDRLHVRGNERRARQKGGQGRLRLRRRATMLCNGDESWGSEQARSLSSGNAQSTCYACVLGVLDTRTRSVAESGRLENIACVHRPQRVQGSKLVAKRNLTVTSGRTAGPTCLPHGRHHRFGASAPPRVGAWSPLGPQPHAGRGGARQEMHPKWLPK